MKTVRLEADDEEAIRTLVAATAGLLEVRGSVPRLRAVLTGPALSTALMAALIGALRRLRERGGALVVEAESESARATLAMTGLDRVFALPIGDEGSEPAGPVSRLAALVHSAAALFAVLLVLLSPAANAQPAPSAGPPSDPAEIIARVVARNPDVSSYQARVHIDLRLRSFPYLREHLDGSTYFKRPANYEVAFDHIPSYARGFERMYTDIGDPANWERRFVVTVVGTRSFEGHQDIELRLVQRVRGMIDHETVLVDPVAWSIDELEYHYYTGGVIRMTQHFQTIAGRSMLAAQDADIAIPYVHAVAHGTYSDYHVNVAIDDGVFTVK
jgi:hypothetical protein